METNEESKKRIESFFEAYKKLVDEHKVDLMTYPMFVPNDKGTWELKIETRPVDTTNQPVKSPLFP